MPLYLVNIVDDEENIRQITLEKFGYRVVTATDGTANVRALRRLNRVLKIIAASGLTTNEQSADLLSLNFNAFSAKPYTAEKLLAQLSPSFCKRNKTIFLPLVRQIKMTTAVPIKLQIIFLHFMRAFVVILSEPHIEARIFFARSFAFKQLKVIVVKTYD